MFYAKINQKSQVDRPYFVIFMLISTVSLARVTILSLRIFLVSKVPSLNKTITFSSLSISRSPFFEKESSKILNFLKNL